jgi:hypothetical protein
MTHVLDLELEDIGKLDWVKAVVQHANLLRKFVRNHQHVLAAFQEVAVSMLTKPGETRFATVLIGLECLKKNRLALVATHARKEVRDYVNRSRSQRSTETGSTLEAQYIESKGIVNDDSFWEKLDGVSVVVAAAFFRLLPLMLLLCFCCTVVVVAAAADCMLKSSINMFP